MNGLKGNGENENESTSIRIEKWVDVHPDILTLGSSWGSRIHRTGSAVHTEWC